MKRVDPKSKGYKWIKNLEKDYRRTPKSNNNSRGSEDKRPGEK